MPPAVEGARVVSLRGPPRRFAPASILSSHPAAVCFEAAGRRVRVADSHPQVRSRANSRRKPSAKLLSSDFRSRTSDTSGEHNLIVLRCCSLSGSVYYYTSQ